MGEFFKNKFRVNSIRKQDWDYSWVGKYYVTICTKDRFCCLGEIRNDKVYLSEIGKIVYEEWLKTSELRPNVLLDDFIIMPNHVHGIIVIKDNDFDKRRDAVRHGTLNKLIKHDKEKVETQRSKVLKDNDFDKRRDAVHRVSTSKFGPLKPKSLSIIVNTFKGAVTRQCNKNNLNFHWQSRYYEHIIRDDDDYTRIKKYIANNPVNWLFDKNNPENK